MKLIVAYDQNKAIGYKNTFPWPRILEDLKWFKEHTLNTSVIMGRNTWTSLPFKLPNRQNIVVSNSIIENKPDNIVSTINEAIDVSNLPIMFIGGKRIYEEAINIVDEMLITEINNSYIGDTFFPVFDQNKWKKTIISETPLLKFCSYVRI